MKIRAFAACVLLVLASVLPVVAGTPPFSFVQISDQHFPNRTSERTIADLAALGDIRLKPYGLIAPKPSFVIETGDITEFGDKDGALEVHNRAYAPIVAPRYMALGNHDETWQALSPLLTKLYGAPYYSWNEYGCHFVVLDTPGLQDPRPILGPEQLRWLERDLRAVGPDVPVFLAFHHPLTTTEFSSSYEVDRLMDILRPYNIVVALVGHSHSVRRLSFDGIDLVIGGSSQGPCPPGYTIVNVSDGYVSIAYKELGASQATRGLLRKPLCRTSKPYPTIGLTVSGASPGLVGFAVVTDMAPAEIGSAYAMVDGKTRVELRSCGGKGASYEGALSTDGLTPGMHSVRACLEGTDGTVYHRSTEFGNDCGDVRSVWRAKMGAASKSTPAVSGDSVFVGANDGCLRCYRRGCTEPTWRFRTGGAIAGGPLVLNGRVYCGSADGRFYCVSTEGDRVWERNVGSPVYAPPVSDGTAVYFGAANGSFWALDASTGAVKWVNRDASYTIESKAFLADGKVFYGSWDTYVYCLNAADGATIWKCVGQGSAEKFAAPYYAPADCGPVVCCGRVFIADRKFRLSIVDVGAGKIGKFLNGVSGVGRSEDGQHVYLRLLDGNLEKIDGSGSVAWKTQCSLDDVPAVPVESDGVVYVCSKKGLVSALSADKGQVLWQYQATPQSYVLSSVASCDGGAVVSGTDGALTEIRSQSPRDGLQ